MHYSLQLICKNHFALPVFSKQNGIVIPEGLKWKAHPKRVLIHPTSTQLKKNWTERKFLRLSGKVEQQGFKSYICVSPDERQSWESFFKQQQLPLFPTLAELARFIYESGFMIGNDSGIGHLASLLQIPTLTLFAKKSYSRLWRPEWGPGQVITPPNILLISKLKTRYWEHTLTVGRVLRAFLRMQRKKR